jgi:Rrf2 family protein
MILSRASEYGIQALLFLAGKPPGRFVTVREIARGARVSAPFLSKVLGQLAAHGLLASLKGPRGGVRLARPAKEITVLDVVEAIDGLGFLRQCVIGLPRCSSEAPCPLHSMWGPLREEIRTMFSGRSVEELMRSPGRSIQRGVPAGRRARAATAKGRRR